MGWWPAGDRSTTASLRLARASPASASTQVPPSSGPRCLIASAIAVAVASNSPAPILFLRSRIPAMPHMTVTFELWRLPLRFGCGSWKAPTQPAVGRSVSIGQPDEADLDAVGGDPAPNRARQPQIHDQEGLRHDAEC